MKSFSQKDNLGREEIDSRIIRYLSGWPEGLSTDRMAAWIRSCVKAGGYSMREFEDSLTRLRNAGSIAIANKIWYTRKVKND